ncbi:hypothetical protein [Pricia sp.]|uniref:hypothetical protein n=1 Tax=Pricia sp. TaxID=2268138 RepID=UPI003594278F
MNDIKILYQNELSIAFYWKRCPVDYDKKVQIVFRDTGLLLTRDELIQFSGNIERATNSCSLCKDCKNKESCRALLLDTPAPQISFAVSHKELTALKDLVNVILFQLRLDNLLDGIADS